MSILEFVTDVGFGLGSTWERGAGGAWIEEVQEEYLPSLDVGFQVG